LTRPNFQGRNPEFTSECLVAYKIVDRVSVLLAVEIAEVSMFRCAKPFGSELDVDPLNDVERGDVNEDVLTQNEVGEEVEVNTRPGLVNLLYNFADSGLLLG
jgi:hypothetical protein